MDHDINFRSTTVYGHTTVESAQHLRKYPYQLAHETEESSTRRFTRECLKLYVQEQIQNRSVRSKGKPIDVKTTFSSFNKEKFENIMEQKLEE